MNLISHGAANIILNGNPQKTFFKAKYNKTTNFGLQRIRLEYEGQRNLSFDKETIFKFKVPRHGDLLHDTYIVINMPNIWSPIYKKGERFIPYEFRWTDDFACAMINKITIRSGGSIISEYSGESLHILKERDYTTNYTLWNRMAGNIPKYTDPANAYKRKNKYPSVIRSDQAIPEPSIRGGQIVIPLEAWFCKSSKMALPLVAMQYQETTIEITTNPINQLYTVLNVTDDGKKRIAPKSTDSIYSINRFITPPSRPQNSNDVSLNGVSSENIDVGNGEGNDYWNADIHLMATYVFLGDAEKIVFAKNSHSYLIKNIHEHKISDIANISTVDIVSKNIVVNWTFRLRRSDVVENNQWFNYTNWPEKDKLPNDVKTLIEDDSYHKIYYYNEPHEKNEKEILKDMTIKMGGKIRENNMPSYVYNWIEKFYRTSGMAKDGLYCYNFALNNSSYDIQPSGGMNVNLFNKIQMTITTTTPEIEEDNTIEVACDSEGNFTGFFKNPSDIYKWRYELFIMEERYNVIEVSNGMMGLKYAR